MTGREVEEWVGANPNAPAPPRVRLRTFERHHGICHISGRKIMPGDLWELDHIIALINGGENRESNLAPALKDKHREKTAEDVAEKAIIAQKRQKHLGIRKKSRFPGSRDSGLKKKMNGDVVRR